MFLGVLNTVFLNISNYLPHLELRNCSIQIVVIMNFVVISNVGIKRFDCIILLWTFFASIKETSVALLIVNRGTGLSVSSLVKGFLVMDLGSLCNTVKFRYYDHLKLGHLIY